MSEPQEIISVTEQIGQRCAFAWNLLTKANEELELVALTRNPRRYREAIDEMVRLTWAYFRALGELSDLVPEKEK
jgi:hypothetical protein